MSIWNHIGKQKQDLKKSTYQAPEPKDGGIKVTMTRQLPTVKEKDVARKMLTFMRDGYTYDDAYDATFEFFFLEVWLQ